MQNIEKGADVKLLRAVSLRDARWISESRNLCYGHGIFKWTVDAASHGLTLRPVSRRMHKQHVSKATAGLCCFTPTAFLLHSCGFIQKSKVISELLHWTFTLIMAINYKMVYETMPLRAFTSLIILKSVLHEEGDHIYIHIVIWNRGWFAGPEATECGAGQVLNSFDTDMCMESGKKKWLLGSCKI